MKKILFLFVILVMQALMFSQSKQFCLSDDVFGNRSFVQNNGQFNFVEEKKFKILYKYDYKGECIYFTDNGLIYKQTEVKQYSHRQIELFEEGRKNLDKPKEYFVFMNWNNSNNNINVVPSQEQTNYFSYGDKEFKSSVFKKITYQNVYNNIDIEYIIPENETEGIKYNIILNPGADANNIKISYSGDLSQIIINKNGEVIIKGKVNDIKEHIPFSYFKNNKGVKVPCRFQLTDNLISFVFEPSFKLNETLVIDPWVSTITTMSTNDYAYDVDYDYAGNLYVHGGTAPFKVAKYNALGVLLWTFAGVVPSQSWTSSGNYPPKSLVGNFLVQKINQKCYVGQGWQSNGSRIVRLDANGVYDNFITTANVPMKECWDMAFNCNTNEVITMGGHEGTNSSGGIVNQNTGTLVPTTFYPVNTGSGHDVVSGTIDESGVLYVIYASAQTAFMNNKIIRVNATYNNNVWMVPSSFNSFAENDNKASYVGSGLGLGSSNGFNCLGVNNNYLFYYDGLNLAVYNKLTGALLSSIVISGQIIRNQGGIAIDDCNNIYVGGNGSILCFNFNGTVISALVNISLGISIPNKYVYDLKLDKNSNLLYVSGSGFTGVYNAINSNSCSNQLSIVSSCIGFNNASVTANLTTNVTNPIVSYTWTNSGGSIISQTNNTSSLTNSVTGLTNGIYTLYSQMNSPCGIINSQTISINCTCNVTMTPNISVVDASCSSALGSITINSIANGVPNYTITEAAATFTTNINLPYTISGVSIGTHTYGVVSANGCNTTFTASIQQIGLPPNLSVTSPAMLNCIQSTTLNATSTSSAVTFSWTGFNITSGAQTQSPTVNLIGNYTVTITQGLCTNSAVVTVMSNSNIPTITITPTLSAICSGQTSNLIATGANTYSWSSNTTLSSSSGSLVIANPLITTVYTVTGTSNNCTNTAVATVSVLSNPTISLSSNTTICQGAGSSATLTVNGANSYTWSNSSSLSSSIDSIVLASPNITTSYTVMGLTGACSNTAVVTVSVNPSPIITATSVNNTSCGLANGSVTITSSPSNNLYTWSSGVLSTTNIASFLAPSNYTITVSNGVCQTTTVISILNSIPLTIISSTVLPSNCNLNDGSIYITDNLFGSNYSWSPNVSVTNSAINLATGNYALTIINGACNTSTVFNVGSIGGFIASITTNVPNCESNDGVFIIDSIAGGKPPYQTSFNNTGYTGNTTFEQLSTGIYTLSILDSNLCITDFLLTMPENNKDYTLYIPNTFTPNNNKVNDIWYVQGTCLGEFSCLIYNRWGEKIRELRDIKDGWDGTYKGASVPDGVYVYLIEVITKEGTINKVGHITVFR